MAKSTGFQFKQFNIEHERCAMKVGTDSILLGSWAKLEDSNRVLDIGTGSGILAIMLGQKGQPGIEILGIDIDAEAIRQAQHNIDMCPWPDKLRVKHLPLHQLKANNHYDLIISNPPYFEPKTGPLEISDPQFIQEERRFARHTHSLAHNDLLAQVSGLLQFDGRFYCVLPEHVCDRFVQQASEAGLFCETQLLVKSYSHKNVIRRLFKLRKKQLKPKSKHLVIHNDDGTYTDVFKNICKDYYLNF